jgi:hypothetical protein
MGQALNRERIPRYHVTVSFFIFCIVVVGVEGIVAAVVVEVAIMEEEEEVFRRGPSVFFSFGGVEEYCGVGTPFGPNLHQHRPTSCH